MKLPRNKMTTDDLVFMIVHSNSVEDVISSYLIDPNKCLVWIMTDNVTVDVIDCEAGVDYGNILYDITDRLLITPFWNLRSGYQECVDDIVTFQNIGAVSPFLQMALLRQLRKYAPGWARK